MAQAVDAACALDVPTNLTIKCKKKKLFYTRYFLLKLREEETRPSESVIHQVVEMNLVRGSPLEHNLQRHGGRKWKRNRRSFQGRKKKNTTPKFNIISWNIEGLKNAISTAPDNNIFHNADIVCLNETLTYSAIDHQDYYSFSIDADKPERGRPIGGLCMLIKPHMQPHSPRGNKDCISVDTIVGRLFCFYFNPTTDINDITHCLTEQLLDCKSETLVVGDFNCRLDTDNAKGNQLIHTMRTLGMELVTTRNAYTYISHNGKSNIDLVFANISYVKNILGTSILLHPLRKHQQILTTVRIKSKTRTVNRNPTPKRIIINLDRFTKHEKLSLLKVKSTAFEVGNIECYEATASLLCFANILGMKGDIISCPHKDIYFLETNTKSETTDLANLFAPPAGREMAKYKPRTKLKHKHNPALEFFVQSKAEATRQETKLQEEGKSTTGGNQSSRRNSIDLYEEAATILGLTCAQTDDCKCIECQCHYFDFEEEMDFPSAGGECVVDHTSSCSIQ